MPFESFISYNSIDKDNIFTASKHAQMFIKKNPFMCNFSKLSFLLLFIHERIFEERKGSPNQAIL